MHECNLLVFKMCHDRHHHRVTCHVKLIIIYFFPSSHEKFAKLSIATIKTRLGGITTSIICSIRKHLHCPLSPLYSLNYLPSTPTPSPILNYFHYGERAACARTHVRNTDWLLGQGNTRSRDQSRVVFHMETASPSVKISKLRVNGPSN